MFFPVVIYGCESWTTKKAEHWRIDAFELWCWRRLLRVPWLARRSNQSILKETSLEYSLERLMLKMKPQYFGHLLKTTNSLAKTLMLGNIKGRRRRGQEKMIWLNGITTWWTWVWVSSSPSGSWWWTKKPGGYSPWGCRESGTTEWLNWTEPYMLSIAYTSTYIFWFCKQFKSPISFLWVFLNYNYLPLYFSRTPLEWVSEVTQSCLTLCDPMDCSPPGSSVDGILQVRILECVAISFSRGSSWPRDWTQVSRIAGRRFKLWATRKAHLRVLQFSFLHLFFWTGSSFHLHCGYYFKNFKMQTIWYIYIYISPQDKLH